MTALLTLADGAGLLGAAKLQAYVAKDGTPSVTAEEIAAVRRKLKGGARE